MKFYFILLCFFLLLVSCNSKICGDDYSKSLNHFLVSNSQKKKIKNVVVIPNEGCGGCISDATLFFKENNMLYKNNTIIIFTGVYDIKQLRISIGSSFLNKKNVFMDKDNIFMNTNVSSIYPQVLKLNQDCVNSVSIFDRENFKDNTVQDFNTQ